jgi:putative transport protein
MNDLAFLSWPGTWLGENSVASGLVLLSLVATVGLALGSIRVRGIHLGISGVLFSALFCGQMGLSIDARVLGFLRDFSLVIFMYAIGLEIGPAFLSSLRTEGLRLNLLAVIVLVLGAGGTVLLCRSLPRGASPGVFVGAFTSTAGLASAQETLRGISPSDSGKIASAQAALAYSITYPLGIVGPMLVIQLLQSIFGISIEQERDALAAARERRNSPPETLDMRVTSFAHAGSQLRDIPLLQSHAVLLTRLLRDNVVSVPSGDTELRLGDVVQAVGPPGQLEQLVSLIGERAGTELSHAGGDIDRVQLIVTRTHVLHRPLHELNLVHRTGYTITSVTRAGVALIPSGSLRLIFADHIVAVGPRMNLKLIETELGNQMETLEKPRLVPIFLGIVLGVLVGSFPLVVPGTHATVRLGLAGGSLIIAIVLAQLGSLGSVVWYMPPASNRLFRDFGLAIFLACVGLTAGAGFIQRAATAAGAEILLFGALLSIVPVLVVGCFARRLLKMNFVTLTGWVAGTMGNSTTLLYASESTGSEAPALAYAAVTPLATLLPILLAQVLVAIG